MAAVPVTRLADLTPLDRLGLPVWSAATPLARDLTTHMGKGIDAVAARVSALMEAVERVSAERTAAPLHRASRRELDRSGVATLDPELCDLPPDTTFAPDATFSWIEGECLGSGETVLLPLDLALTPPGEGILRHVDTNGLAAGNSRLEAIVHALAEVIERDALSQELFAELCLDADDLPPQRLRIDPRTLPTPAGAIVERVLAAGIDVVVDWLVSDIAVPTFRALMIDHAFPTQKGPVPHAFSGHGTAPDAGLAVVRALTEAVQSRLAVIQGARDAFNVAPGTEGAARPFAWLRDFTAQPLLPFDAVPSSPSSDLGADRDLLLARLGGAGLERVIVVDLERPDLGIPVVRVRVPGLACFAVNQRRVGWRCMRHLL